MKQTAESLYQAAYAIGQQVQQNIDETIDIDQVYANAFENLASINPSEYSDWE